MTNEEAINLLNGKTENYTISQFNQAVRLGIEALELFAVLREMARHPRYKSYREDIANKIRCLLPSETGEHNE